MKNTDLPQIKTLLSDDYQENLNESIEFFENLAQEQNFTFEYIQLPTIDQNSIQLLLEVRINPISVFHGHGSTFELARQSSTNLALKYIRCLTKQQQYSTANIATTPLLQTTN